MSEPGQLSRRGFLTGRFGLARRARPSEPVCGPQVARVLPSACVAYRGALCFACREHCPVPGAVVFEHGRPRIDSESCDGCGRCIPACPAPQRAIRSVPRASTGGVTP